MTGFSSDWLTAREPWDHAARNEAVTEAAVAWVRQRPRPVRVVDLGTGRGSNPSFLIAPFHAAQHWTLVDADAGLLAEAEARIAGVETETVVADLAARDPAELVAGADLVTASALLDLVSESWLVRLLGAIREARAAGLFVQTHDGGAGIDPPEPFDQVVRELFDRDMARDKGFGPALGGRAAAMAERHARDLGFEVVAGDSDWRLADLDGEGAAMLLDGWAEAAVRQAPERRGEITAWRRRLSKRPIREVRVGHRDLFIAHR